LLSKLPEVGLRPCPCRNAENQRQEELAAESIWRQWRIFVFKGFAFSVIVVGPQASAFWQEGRPKASAFIIIVGPQASAFWQDGGEVAQAARRAQAMVAPGVI
jgi:hypothetical protein